MFVNIEFIVEVSEGLYTLSNAPFLSSTFVTYPV